MQPYTINIEPSRDSALVVLDDNVLYKSTHSPTHSQQYWYIVTKSTGHMLMTSVTIFQHVSCTCKFCALLLCRQIFKSASVTIYWQVIHILSSVCMGKLFFKQTCPVYDMIDLILTGVISFIHTFMQALRSWTTHICITIPFTSATTE